MADPQPAEVKKEHECYNLAKLACTEPEVMYWPKTEEHSKN